ncbi:MAG TPA: efflux RND transporter periplasmic adaptor subunit [Acidothermaceae bacterium]
MALVLVIVVGSLTTIAVALRLKSSPTVVVATKAAPGFVQVTANGTGALGAIKDATVPVSFPGVSDPIIVKSVSVVVGTQVRAGDPIATIDPTAIQDYVDQLQAVVNNDKVAVSVAATAVQKAVLQATLEVEEQHLAAALQYSSTIVAPTSGVISNLFGNVGSVILSGRPIAEIISLSELRATIAVPATQVGTISVGEGVALTFPQLPSVTATASVQAISPGSSNQGLNVPVTIVLNTVSPLLRVGMQVYATFSKQVAATTALPLIAVHDPDGSAFVFTVDADSRVHEQPVVVAGHDLSTAALASGLPAGALVVMTNAQHLKDGDLVKVSKVQ